MSKTFMYIKPFTTSTRAPKIATPIELPSPKDMKDHADKYSVGQDEYKKTLSVALYQHLCRVHKGAPVDKSNVLVLGPTGSGKTFVTQLIATKLGLPVVTVDCSQLTASGYVGASINDIADMLYEQANRDVKLAERGIVILDEIDKIASSGTNDVGTTNVQYELLKLIEGTKISTSSSPTKPGRYLDTSKVLFIASGAFSEMTSEHSSKKLGFLPEDLNKGADAVTLKNKVIKYGLIPEIIGRLTHVAQTHELSLEEYKNILEMETGAINKYKKFFMMQDRILSFNAEAIDEIVQKARSTGLGARALAGTVDAVLKDIQFEVFSEPSYKYCHVEVTKDVVETGAAPDITLIGDLLIQAQQKETDGE